MPTGIEQAKQKQGGGGIGKLIGLAGGIVTGNPMMALGALTSGTPAGDVVNAVGGVRVGMNAQKAASANSAVDRKLASMGSADDLAQPELGESLPQAQAPEYSLTGAAKRRSSRLGLGY